MPLRRYASSKPGVFGANDATGMLRAMRSASKAAAEALSAAKIQAPTVPVVANVTARAETNPAIIRQLLVDQVTGMVRWRESIQYIKAQDVAATLEVGAGKVLSGLNKRIEPELESFNIGTPAELTAFANMV